MLRRALLTVVVLSYLICVLLLSGVQKDDLDVNTLRKLQQRNVNIHDANNEAYRECFRNNSVTTMKAEEMLKTLLSSTTVQIPIREFDNNIKFDLKLNNLFNMRYQNDERNEIGNEIVVTRGRRTVTTETSFVPPSMLLYNNDNNKEFIEHTEGKPKSQNVIDFWQKHAKGSSTDNSIIKMSSDNNIFSSELTKMLSSTPEKIQTEMKPYSKVKFDNDLENSNIVEGGYLSNMLSEYISKQKTSLVTSMTTRRSDDLGTEDFLTDDDTDIFKYLLNTNKKESSETHNINAHLSKYSYEINFSKGPHKKIDHNNHRSNSFENDELKNIFVGDFEDLKSNNEYVDDKPSTSLLYISRGEKKYGYGRKRPKDIQHIVKPKCAESMSDNEYLTSTLPSDLIKKIAENVKTLLLKDLHKENGDANVTTSLTTTSVRTPGTTTKSTPKNITNKNLESSYVIEKIMEILQKYRTENDSNISSTTEQNKKINEYHRISKVVYPSLLPPIKNYAMNPAKYFKNFPYKLAHTTKKTVRSESRDPYRKPLNDVRNRPPAVNSVNTVNNFRTRPITIQTNLNEIPPLGIPVSNPLELVSQDIITSRPYHQNISIRKYKISGNRNHNKFNKEIRPRKQSFTTEVNQKHHKHDATDDSNNRNVITFRIRDDGDEVNQSNKEEENAKLKNYKSNSNNGYRYRLHSPDNIQRFHEKLERFHPNGSNEDVEKEDCCKDEIFTREQRPINNVNKRDDTSFKNLLRTQQKVTDMLERMLARTKAVQPLSVETT